MRSATRVVLGTALALAALATTAQAASPAVGRCPWDDRLAFVRCPVGVIVPSLR